MRISAILPSALVSPTSLLPKSAPFRPREEQPAAPATRLAPTTSVEMLVAVSAAETQSERRTRTVRRANSGLERLDALRNAMIRGSLDTEALGGLASWASAREAEYDPDMSSLVDEIQLRVLVELAKRERD